MKKTKFLINEQLKRMESTNDENDLITCMMWIIRYIIQFENKNRKRIRGENNEGD